MKKFAVIAAILMLAAPDLALAQSGRGRDRDDDGDRGKGRGRAERSRDDDRGDRGRGRGGDDARQAVREGRRVSLRDVIPQIQRRSPGRLLDSYPETGPGGRPQYRVRWQSNNGQRIDYIVDAETGAIIRRE